MSDLTKPNDTSPASLLRGNKLSSQSSSTFKQRVAQSRAEAVDPQTMPNRICLMLDCSGSMSTAETVQRVYPGAMLPEEGKRRIDLLKDAVQNFVSRCSFRDTAIAINTFPSRSDKALPLTTQSALVIGYAMGLDASGGTPLHGCLTKSIEDVAMTRGVIVSDGGATDWDRYSYRPDEDEKNVEDKADAILNIYKEQSIPLDCVHISTSDDGEVLLRRIASVTGGIFMKFTDVNAFSKAFGFLAPSQRMMLTDGSVTAKQLGAKEIK